MHRESKHQTNIVSSYSDPLIAILIYFLVGGFLFGNISSVGQSSRLISGRSPVQIQDIPFSCCHLQERHFLISLIWYAELKRFHRLYAAYLPTQLCKKIGLGLLRNISSVGQSRCLLQMSPVRIRDIPFSCYHLQETHSHECGEDFSYDTIYSM